MKIQDNISTSQSVIITTDNPLSEISSASIYVNGSLINSVNPGNSVTIWFETITDTEVPGRALIKVNNLYPETCYEFSATIFANPYIEFWKNDFNFAPLDTALVGGTWSNGVVADAFGVNPQDLIVDGDRFMSPSMSFAPEELVPGHTQDSIGLNVYTQGTETSAVIISGSFPVTQGQPTTARISVLPDAYSGIVVYFNNKIFNRSTTTNISNNQFFVDGKNLILPPQPVSGIAGFTYVRIGGIGLIDSNSIEVAGQSTALVESLAAFDDVHSVYVLVDGKEVSAYNSSTNVFGYILENSWIDNNRAAIRIMNIPVIPGIPNTPEYQKHTIDAWFFNTPYVKFNRMNEQIITVTSATQNFTLTYPPGEWEPYSDKAMVEISATASSTERRRLYPPYTSYYTKKDNELTYLIDNRGILAPSYFSASEVLVYANGTLIRPGIDYFLDLPTNSIILALGLYPDGTQIAIVSSKYTGTEYDYIISGNTLRFPAPISNKNIRVITFNNHNSLGMRTETFTYNPTKRFKLMSPVLDDNYIWVYMDGIPLVHRFDFEVLPDNRTIQLDEDLQITGNPKILVTIIQQPEFSSKVFAYRIFQDFFERTHYKRLSAENSTFLTEFLTYKNDKLRVFESGKLSPSNYAQNIPGVVLVDRERIEFFHTDNNELQILRRGTLGTGPAFYIDEGAKVIDQGISQTIPYQDTYKIQRFLSTGTTTYIISTSTSTTIGDGITINTGTIQDVVHAVDQLVVYYGGRKLRKTAMRGYTSVTSTNLVTMLPEFTVNTSTQELVLNIENGVGPGVEITVLQKLGYIWTGTQSLLLSMDRQSKFIRQKEGELPDTYFYGGDPRMLDANYEPLTTDDGITLRRY